MRKTDETDKEWFDRMVRERKLTPEVEQQFYARVQVARAAAAQHAWTSRR